MHINVHCMFVYNNTSSISLQPGLISPGYVHKPYKDCLDGPAVTGPLFGHSSKTMPFSAGTSVSPACNSNNICHCFSYFHKYYLNICATIYIVWQIFCLWLNIIVSILLHTVFITAVSSTETNIKFT